MIVRKTDYGLKNIHFDLSKADALPHVYPQDTIVLHGETCNRTNRVFDRTIQVLSILTTIALILAL